MTTAQDRLNSILPSWYELLTQWSSDGSLVAAATDALVLDGTKSKEGSDGLLQSYVSQWSAGNFKNLPQIVLLSADDISGAYGAYADSTDTIYLNQDWLLTATEEEIQKVLTEELGHYLDDQLNEGDTKGDEGELFARLINDESVSLEQVLSLRAQADSGFVNTGDGGVSVQLNSPYYVFNGSRYIIVTATSWSGAQEMAESMGGNLVTINSKEENEWIASTFTSDILPQVELRSNCYIGYTDEMSEGNWSWISGESVDYTNWGNTGFGQEPNGGTIENYGHIYLLPEGETNYSPLGTWNDVQNDYGGRVSLGLVEIKLRIGTSSSNDKSVVVSGDLFSPKVESYTTATSGKGKNSATVYSWTNILVNQNASPLDALVVSGGDSNNSITAAGFQGDPSTPARSAFSGVLVIDGKGGADTITGGIGTNWLIGGGVSSGVDILTGTTGTSSVPVKDFFDLRVETLSGYSDSYSIGNADIRNFNLFEDFIVLSGASTEYRVASVAKGTKVSRFDIYKGADLLATVAGSGFTTKTDLTSRIIFGQNTQSPFEVDLGGGSTIFG
jgi:hypothetical protein